MPDAAHAEMLSFNVDYLKLRTAKDTAKATLADAHADLRADLLEEAASPHGDDGMGEPCSSAFLADDAGGRPRRGFAACGVSATLVIGDRALRPEPSAAFLDRLRLRCINPSIDRIYELRLSGVAGNIVALDGMPLPAPRPLAPIILAPGQRCDVIADVTGPVRLTDTYGGTSVTLGEIAMEGSRTPRRSAIPGLPANAMPAPGPVDAHVDLVMQGGAGGGDHDGFGTWALNDVSGLPRRPLVDVRRGATVRMTLRNATAFPHVMHLHGHHFHELDARGASGAYRDSTLVGAGAARDILCVLDNPGSWMLHCHMLSHQTDGMATWVRVR